MTRIANGSVAMTARRLTQTPMSFGTRRMSRTRSEAHFGQDSLSVSLVAVAVVIARVCGAA